MSSNRNRRDSDPRGDSYDDYQRRDSYSRNGNGESYGGTGGYDDRDPYKPRDYDDRLRTEKRHRSPDDRSRRSSRQDRGGHGQKDKEESALDKVKHSFGGSDESYIATGVGAVAGAFLGGEATKKKNGPISAPVATILGAVLGGLSANAIDKQYELRREKRKEENRHDDYRR